MVFGHVLCLLFHSACDFVKSKGHFLMEVIEIFIFLKITW